SSKQGRGAGPGWEVSMNQFRQAASFESEGRRGWSWTPLLVAGWLASLASAARGDDEAYLFTPPGSQREGHPQVASGPEVAGFALVVRDRATGNPTFCRVNVVGGDGDYYQPAPNEWTPYSLTGEWPRTGRGNRRGKAPIRYYGRFFYCPGEATVAV